MPPTESKARICCLDLDTFFVSVERLNHPELIGKPVVVGALPGSRGVVTAASYEVRRFGVRSGMPIAEAYRRAPRAIYLPGHHGEYGKYGTSHRLVAGGRLAGSFSRQRPPGQPGGTARTMGTTY